MAKVSVVKGYERYQNIAKCLKLIESEIKLEGKKVFIKPNFTSVSNQLAATHVDGVQAVLDFISGFKVKEIVVGEGSGTGDTFKGFRNFGYLKLRKDYNIELIDLNQDSYEKIEILDKNFDPMKIRIAKTPLEFDYRISVCPPKTHDTVILTLGLKNMVVGCIIGEDKKRVHQGYKAINLNLFRLGKILYPHLSVLDGFESMEGNGPVNGEKVELKACIASTNFLAADAVAAKGMGFEPEEIGYLHYCSLGGFGTLDTDKIEIVGKKIENVKKTFKPHQTYKKQRNWRIKNEDEMMKKLN
ncbi:MAG: DUF362 domain-containing protein [Candidatus Thermoplasmatota archaeon]|nr:DUF362 domain-containing protein [Candidatus Thermoplasmatota archaeon]